MTTDKPDETPAPVVDALIEAAAPKEGEHHSHPAETTAERTVDQLDQNAAAPSTVIQVDGQNVADEANPPADTAGATDASRDNPPAEPESRHDESGVIQDATRAAIGAGNGAPDGVGLTDEEKARLADIEAAKTENKDAGKPADPNAAAAAAIVAADPSAKPTSDTEGKRALGEGKTPAVEKAAAKPKGANGKPKKSDDEGSIDDDVVLEADGGTRTLSGNRARLWNLLKRGATHQQLMEATGMQSALGTANVLAREAGMQVVSEPGKKGGAKTYKLATLEAE